MSVTLRPTTVGDLELICRHRVEMFRDAGVAEHSLAVMAEHFRPWLAPHLEDGSYFGFVASADADGDGEGDADGRPVASIGLMLIDWPPHPAHPTDSRRGYVLNVFVEPDYRRRGLASELMRAAEAEFAGRGVQFAVLHATEKGQAVYNGLGWDRTSEMAKRLTDSPAGLASPQ